MITKNILSTKSGISFWDDLGLPDSLWERCSIPDSDRVFREGDASDALYIVEAGCIRIELERAELDSESVLSHVVEGEIFGEQGLLDGGKRSASAIAEGNVQLKRLSLEKLKQLESEDPESAIAVYRALGQAVSQKLRGANEQLSNAVFSPKDPYVEDTVAKAGASRGILEDLEPAALDRVIDALAAAVANEASSLADLTVEVTRMGRAKDKLLKNQFASVGVAANNRGKSGTGILDQESGQDQGLVEIGEAAGVVFGLIPITNPVATAIFKVITCLKSRNAVILSFPRRAARLGQRFAEIIAPVLKSCGLSADIVHCVTQRSSRRMTEAFFQHPGVNLILATGGSSMVEAAYRSGKPALGVGPGNAPVLICNDADPGEVAGKIIASKSFDNGLICGSEHNLIVVETMTDVFIQSMEHLGAAVLDHKETERFRSTVVSEDGSALRRKFLGKPAAELAAAAGIEREGPILLLVVNGSTKQIEAGDFVGGEKMAPVLGLFRVESEAEGFTLSLRLLEREGKGHTAVIHTEDRQRALDFASKMPASRILVNSPATQGVIGQTTALEPSLVLGCGYFGGNSTNDNVGFRHLRNIKRVAFYQAPGNEA